MLPLSYLDITMIVNFLFFFISFSRCPVIRPDKWNRAGYRILFGYPTQPEFQVLCTCSSCSWNIKQVLIYLKYCLTLIQYILDIFKMVDFFGIFVLSQNTEIRIKLNFLLEMYVETSYTKFLTQQVTCMGDRLMKSLPKFCNFYEIYQNLLSYKIGNSSGFVIFRNSWIFKFNIQNFVIF